MRSFLLLAVALVPGSLFAQCGSELVASSTAVPDYVVYMPTPASCYSGIMILFAHGYVPPGAPPGTWKEQFTTPDGTSIPGLLNSFGLGFAASGYSKDGLAIAEGMHDTKALTDLMPQLNIPVQKYFITGASEGGLIAAKLLEKDTFFSGGFAICGPLGDFTTELNYGGDVRVLFDYFFPGILPGNVINVPSEVIANWPAYETKIKNAVNSRPLATLQLLSAAHIGIGFDFSNADDAIAQLLWYNVTAIDDLIATLGGSPYDNIGRVYKGSFNDARLNSLVQRYAASPAVAPHLPDYNTTGQLKNLMVTYHTVWDPTVPYEQETVYGAKVAAAGKSPKLLQFPSFQYGHCNVTRDEATLGLILMLFLSGF